MAYKLFEFTAAQNWLPATVNIESWQPWIVVLAGIMAILGHSKSIFLGFSGGKSVATSLGILLALNWQVGLATFGIFAVMIAITRIVSLSSISGAIAVSIVMILLNQPLAYIIFGVAGGIYVTLRHKTNIERILTGTEPKLGQKDELKVDTESTVNSAG